MNMNRTWVDIDLAVLDQNIRLLKQEVRNGTEIMFVIKANAYGHGIKAVAVKARECGIQWLTVAFLEEALEVREVVQDGRVMLMGVVSADDVPILIEKKITPIVVSEDHAKELSDAAVGLGKTLSVHFKVDTGMGRLGTLWSDAIAAGRAMLQMKGIELEGLCTHFAAVEKDNPKGANEQVRRFVSVAEALEKDKGAKLFKHISSSRAVMLYDEWDLDGIRPGIILYGYGAMTPDGRIRTRPVLQWKSRLVQVRRVAAGFPIGYYSTYVTDAVTHIGVVGLGYSDGYLRTLSNKCHVLVRGERCPVIGRVSMNWITVDLGPDSEAKRGDEVVLIGEQEGESIWANELAKHCRTIPYEILTNIKTCIPRYYKGIKD